MTTAYANSNRTSIVRAGYHNYHHTFPRDYQTNEYGKGFNLSRVFIDVMACIGQTYDLKVTQPDAVAAAKKRTAGDPKYRTYFPLL